MNQYTIRPLNAPPLPRIDIVFGENIHAEAVYDFNHEDVIELIALMAPVGHNGSSINIMDSLNEAAIAHARISLRDTINEAE